MSNVKRIVALLGFSSGVLASPLIANDSSESSIVPNKYIVRVAPGTYDSDFESYLRWVANVPKRSLSRRSTAGVEKTFSVGDFKAYAGEFDVDAIAEIEKDGYVSRLCVLATKCSDTDLRIQGRQRRARPSCQGDSFGHSSGCPMGTYKPVFDNSSNRRQQLQPLRV